MEYNDEWEPFFRDDFEMDFEMDPISLIRHNVFNMNEAWDNRIIGFRGGGKSTVGMSLLLLYNPELLDLTPRKIINKSWCFTTEDRNAKKKKLRRGDVLVTDEQGTRLSGSSYKWRDYENQMLADSKQIDRVDGVLEIGITLDEMRVVKRVRNVYRVDVFPEQKLNTFQNKGIGMGIDCIMREIVENPFANHDNERFRQKYFNYATAGRISRVTLPLPPAELWNVYMEERRKFKERLESEELQGPQKDVGKNYDTLKERLFQQQTTR